MSVRPIGRRVFLASAFLLFCFCAPSGAAPRTLIAAEDDFAESARLAELRSAALTPESCVEIAALLQSRTNSDAALEQLHACQATFPDHAGLNESLFALYFTRGQTLFDDPQQSLQAEAALRQALLYRPTSALTRYYLGLLALRRDDSAAALSDLLAAAGEIPPRLQENLQTGLRRAALRLAETGRAELTQPLLDIYAARRDLKSVEEQVYAYLLLLSNDDRRAAAVYDDILKRTVADSVAVQNRAVACSKWLATIDVPTRGDMTVRNLCLELNATAPVATIPAPAPTKGTKE